MPHLYNPAKQFIATANHNILPPGYKHQLNYEFSLPYRFRRIEEVLGKGGKFTVADFECLQHDETSLVARELIPILKSIKDNKDVTSDPIMRDAMQMLLNWDYVMSKDSTAALIFEALLNELRTRIFDSAIKPDVLKLVESRVTPSQIIKVMSQESNWVYEQWYHSNSQSAYSKGDFNSLIMLISLKSALMALQKQLGSDMKKWRWGDVHVAEFKHQLPGKLTNNLFDLPSVARGGDANTVNATGGPRYKQTAGASYRQVLDLSDWDNSVAVNVPGQSGQPFSPHYGDLLPLWAEGKYFPLLFSRQKIEQHSHERLMLVPRNYQEVRGNGQ